MNIEPAIIEARTVWLADPATTLDAGARLARGLGGGMVVTCAGELGAGKTTLVRGVLRGLGWQGAVKSPTYGMVEHYKFSSLYFYHFDFYRVADVDEWDDLGFGEYFRPDSVCMIEWPERVQARLPAADLSVTLAVDRDGRSARLAARTGRGNACLDALAAPLG
ncbi:MAG: tRNA (adenosine(37)-N6)-threonylcarbamoyltransferase complex ATPase subunit type 1 TsaE [Betaproteobacteria bacterium]